MDVSYYKNSLSFLRFGFGAFSLAKIADLKEVAQWVSNASIRTLASSRLLRER
jgi:hypothetical protein